MFSVAGPLEGSAGAFYPYVLVRQWSGSIVGPTRLLFLPPGCAQKNKSGRAPVRFAPTRPSGNPPAHKLRPQPAQQKVLGAFKSLGPPAPQKRQFARAKRGAPGQVKALLKASMRQVFGRQGLQGRCEGAKRKLLDHSRHLHPGSGSIILSQPSRSLSALQVTSSMTSLSCN